MRALIIIAPALLLGACQVTEDKANSQTTVSYNEDVAENAGAAALNTLDQAAGAIVNDTKEAGAALRNIDVDVSVGNKTDGNQSAPANSNLGFRALRTRVTRSIGRGVGEWRSLVARLLWEQRVAGSNPVSPTNDS